MDAEQLETEMVRETYRNKERERESGVFEGGECV